MRTGVALTIAGVLAVAAGPSSASTPADRVPASTSGVAANSARFSDPAGDVPAGGMDVTNVTVSNDNAGQLRFAIEIPSHQTLPTGKELQLAFDVDRNASTGSSAGNEYAIFVVGTGNTIGFYRYDAAQNVYLLVSGTPLVRQYSGGVLAIEFNRSILGTVSSFDIELYTGPEDFPTVDDFVPNTGKWTYEIKIDVTPPQQRVAIASFSRQPKTPVAGEGFTVSVGVRRVGWAGRFNGTVYCDAKIAGRRARWFGSVDPGRAACRWDIPAGAAGDTIRGSIGVSDGQSPVVTRRFTARIAPRKATLATGGASREQPRAGSRFYYALTVFVRTAGTESRISKGTVDCRATVSGRALANPENIVLKKEGIRCAWEVPAGTTGRMLVGTIVVRSQGATLRHRFSRRIR